MKKIIEFLEKTSVGKIILMLVTLLVNLIPGGGNVAKSLGDQFKKLGYNQKVGQLSGWIIFAISLFFLGSYYFGAIDKGTIESSIKVLEQVKEMPVDTVVSKDTLVLDSVK